MRLVGPKPKWARPDGGEAGLHPSNIHDNAYAVGTIDFTGDMPILLGPDGPSLGGFVCPGTIVQAELWKLGQLKAGDLVQFHRVTLAEAEAMEQEQDAFLRNFTAPPPALPEASATEPAVLKRVMDRASAMTFRADGDKYLLVEYGKLELDLNLRFRVHILEQHLRDAKVRGIIDITPGVRSLHIHYDSRRLARQTLIDTLDEIDRTMPDLADITVPSRIVHLPLSWDDPQAKLAQQKYMQAVRPDAPWVSLRTSSSSAVSTASIPSMTSIASCTKRAIWCWGLAMFILARRWRRRLIRAIASSPRSTTRRGPGRPKMRSASAARTCACMAWRGQVAISSLAGRSRFGIRGSQHLPSLKAFRGRCASSIRFVFIL